MTAWYLNVSGLVLSTIAAVLMYYFPPRGLVQYTDDGQPQVSFVANPVQRGAQVARRQRILSRLSPCLLGLGFVMQLVSAYMQPPLIPA
jgi:hypothetical protein